MPRAVSRARYPGGTVYPWDRLLNGQAWELRPGRDFSTLASFSNAAKRAAKGRKGGKLVIYTTRRGNVVVQYALKQKPVRLPVPRFGNPRADAMVEMRESGMTYAEIAKRMKVSPQRVQQIVAGGQQGLTFVLNPNSRPGQLKGRRYGHARGEI